jgi:membrane-bound metal-dependent hydrolase YbcI (DUF457 family)
MDIVTHILSGVAIGTVVAGFSKKGIKEQTGIITLSGLGGALPDLDAISLWSGFDRSIGHFLGLHHSGKQIYFSKFWYSHHGFFHSILAAIIIALLAGLIASLIKNGFRNQSMNNLKNYFKDQMLYFLAFVLGFIMHLFEDMPTPACVWKGVNLFWPLKFYTGGTGDIWWWNNYDIFLIIAGVIIINGIFLLAKRIIKNKVKILTIAIFGTGFILSLILIKTRGFDFNYKGQITKAKYEQYENKSKEIQRELLGDKVFNFMSRVDKKLPVNF